MNHQQIIAQYPQVAGLMGKSPAAMMNNLKHPAILHVRVQSVACQWIHHHHLLTATVSETNLFRPPLTRFGKLKEQKPLPAFIAQKSKPDVQIESETADTQ